VGLCHRPCRGHCHTPASAFPTRGSARTETLPGPQVTLSCLQWDTRPVRSTLHSRSDSMGSLLREQRPSLLYFSNYFQLRKGRALLAIQYSQSCRAPLPDKSGLTPSTAALLRSRLSPPVKHVSWRAVLSCPRGPWRCPPAPLHSPAQGTWHPISSFQHTSLCPRSSGNIKANSLFPFQSKVICQK